MAILKHVSEMKFLRRLDSWKAVSFIIDTAGSQCKYWKGTEKQSVLPLAQLQVDIERDWWNIL